MCIIINMYIIYIRIYIILLQNKYTLYYPYDGYLKIDPQTSLQNCFLSRKFLNLSAPFARLLMHKISWEWESTRSKLGLDPLIYSDGFQVGDPTKIDCSPVADWCLVSFIKTPSSLSSIRFIPRSYLFENAIFLHANSCGNTKHLQPFHPRWNNWHAPGTGGYLKLFCSAKAVNASLLLCVWWLDSVVSDDGFQVFLSKIELDIWWDWKAPYLLAPKQTWRQHPLPFSPFQKSHLQPPKYITIFQKKKLTCNIIRKHQPNISNQSKKIIPNLFAPSPRPVPRGH